MICAVRTIVGQERMIADLLEERLNKQKDLGIYSVTVADGVKGYVFMEAENEGEVRRSIQGLPHAKGVIRGSTSVAEIDNLIEAKPLTEGISAGDIVELITGPFKGEKAKINRVDGMKDEVTLELVDVVVPIPVTVKADMVRVMSKTEKIEESEEEE